MVLQMKNETAVKWLFTYFVENERMWIKQEWFRVCEACDNYIKHLHVFIYSGFLMWFDVIQCII